MQIGAQQPARCAQEAHADERLQNARPPWLADAHEALDAAVAAAYGWPADISDAADRCVFIRDLHALHPRPQRRTVIYATRDPADTPEIADRIAVLRRGRIVQCGTPSEIRRAPASRFVLRLFP